MRNAMEESLLFKFAATLAVVGAVTLFIAFTQDPDDDERVWGYRVTYQDGGQAYYPHTKRRTTFIIGGVLLSVGIGGLLLDRRRRSG